MKAHLPRQMSASRRVVNYWLSGMLLALTVALILEGALALSLAIGWLIGINLFSGLFYAIDKLNAEWADDNAKRLALKTRVPEWSLLLLALVGGTPAATLVILLLGHKISDGSFLLRLALIAAVQVAALILFWDQIPWS